MSTEAEQLAAVEKEIEQRETKRRTNLAKAGLMQQVIVILVDRFTTRAVNDPHRTEPIPTPEQAREAIMPSVKAVMERAAALAEQNGRLSFRETIYMAADAAEQAATVPVPAPAPTVVPTPPPIPRPAPANVIPLKPADSTDSDKTQS